MIKHYLKYISTYIPSSVCSLYGAPYPPAADLLVVVVGRVDDLLEEGVEYVPSSRRYDYSVI